MHPQHRALDANAGLAAGVDHYAGAGAIGRPDAPRSISDADGGGQSTRSNDFADDHGLIQIPARGGYHYDVARHEMGFVEPVAEPTRGGGAYRLTDDQCGAGTARTFQVG